MMGVDRGTRLLPTLQWTRPAPAAYTVWVEGTRDEPLASKFRRFHESLRQEKKTKPAPSTFTYRRRVGGGEWVSTSQQYTTTCK